MFLNLKKTWKGYTFLDLILIVLGLGSGTVLGIIFKAEWFIIVFTNVWLLCVFTQAKGKIITQLLGIIGSAIYFFICLEQKYYGEGFIYLFGFIPLYIYGLIHWLRTRKNNSNEVTVRSKLSKKEIIIASIIYVVLCVFITFILIKTNTTQPIINILSVLSLIPALYLLVRRIRFNQVLFLVNDLIVPFLWIILIINGNLSFIPMCICYFFQLTYDIYGIFEWKKLEEKQKNNI